MKEKTMRLSLNINGDLPVDDLKYRVKIAEEAGIEQIWIGELEQFQNPIEVAKEVEPETNAEICVLLSPSRNPCSDIAAAAKKYTTGLIPGRTKDLELFISCLKKVKKEGGVVYAGVSGPKIAEKASQYADGLLLNYVYPEYIEWIKGFLKRDISTYSFGPSLVLPSPFYEDLLIAAAIVLQSNQSFLEAFDLQEMSQRIPLDLSKLIQLRQARQSVNEMPEFRPIKEYSPDLLGLFTISGELQEVRNRIHQLLQLCDSVVLGDPFFRDIQSLKNLKSLHL
ncbi:MAG: hypothetical protein ACLFVI_09110 [Archaeoglobaceae archaeon]